MHQIIHALTTIKNAAQQSSASPEYVRVTLKEELQNYCLAAIYDSASFGDSIFVGGTCLRKLYGLNRLSEDLDFETPGEVDLEALGQTIVAYFKGMKLDYVDYLVQKGAQVSRLTIRFQVLFELGLSPVASEKLHVKIETTRTKADFPVIKTPFIHDQLAFIIKHYDLPTLMAGKINACLHRVWKKGNTGIQVKGRDYYDLIWYMQKDVLPNLEKIDLRNEAGTAQTLATVFSELDEKVSKVTSTDLYTDLRSYFASDAFIREWCNNFHHFYQNYRQQYELHS